MFLFVCLFCFLKRGREQVMENTHKEGTGVLAGVEMKGQLIFGILITPRATDLARTSRRGLGVKTKAPPDQMAAAPLPPSLKPCPLRWAAFGTGLAK